MTEYIVSSLSIVDSTKGHQGWLFTTKILFSLPHKNDVANVIKIVSNTNKCHWLVSSWYLQYTVAAAVHGSLLYLLYTEYSILTSYKALDFTWFWLCRAHVSSMLKDNRQKKKEKVYSSRAALVDFNIGIYTVCRLTDSSKQACYCCS